MSVTAMTCVFETSPATGTARMVELALADAVSEERIKLGSHALAWISQSTIARRCNCSRSSVERSLNRLKSLGRIVDTGQRMDGLYRGTVVYRLPHAEDFDPADLTQPGGTQSDVPQPGGGADDVTQPEADLTQSDDDHPQPGAPPASTVTHKPVVEPAVDPAAKSATGARALAHEGLTDEAVAYPDAETDAARVAAQKARNASVPSDPILSGLSPASTGTAGPTPAQTNAERSTIEAARDEWVAVFETSEPGSSRAERAESEIASCDRELAELTTEVTA